MIPDSDLEIGQTRLLEVDNPVILPENTHVRFIVTSTDVLHDFAIPAAGIKIDATPGRLNQSSFFSEREGELFGQCSELCGTYHGFMPIQVEVGSVEDYLSWISSLMVITGCFASTKKESFPLKNNSLCRLRLAKSSKLYYSTNPLSGPTSFKWLNQFIKKNRKNLLGRFLIGAHKGWELKTLPQEILDFQLNPVIRIIRFLGGLSLLAILGRSYITLSGYFLYIALFFTFVFMVYHIYISYHRIKHIYKLINSEEVEIRNSPLDRFASMAVKAILCAKGLCEQAQPIGSAFGFMLGTDEFLKATGREPFFGPYMASIINKVYPNNSERIREQNRILEQFRELNRLRQEGQDIQQTIETISTDPSLQSLTVSDKKELKEGLQSIYYSNKGELSETQRRIKEILDNYK